MQEPRPLNVAPSIASQKQRWLILVAQSSRSFEANLVMFNTSLWMPYGEVQNSIQRKYCPLVETSADDVAQRTLCVRQRNEAAKELTI